MSQSPTQVSFLELCVSNHAKKWKLELCISINYHVVDINNESGDVNETAGLTDTKHPGLQLYALKIIILDVDLSRVGPKQLSLSTYIV